METQNNSNMLKALIAIKEKVSQNEQDLITKCEEEGVDFPWIPMLYNQLNTTIKAEADAKEKVEKVAEAMKVSWETEMEKFKNQFGEGETLTLKDYQSIGIKVRNKGVNVKDEVFDPIYYLAPEVESKKLRKKVRMEGDVLIIDAKMAGGLFKYLNSLKKKHDEDFKKKNSKTKAGKKKSSGTRERKEITDADEKWIVNEKERDTLIAKYDKIKDKEVEGYYAKEDYGIVYEKYDKRYNAGDKDPRVKDGTILTEDLLKYRLTACIRTTPFISGADSGKCKGAVQWSEGKGKDTSIFTNRVGIQNDPMVQCSQDATIDGWCAKCSAKADSKKFNIFTDKFKKKNKNTIAGYWEDVEVVCGKCD